jgi:hypothetical protein
MRLTYKALRIVQTDPDMPGELVEVEFKVNDDDSSNHYIRKVAETAMFMATGERKVNGWSLDDSQDLADRPKPRTIR